MIRRNIRHLDSCERSYFDVFRVSLPQRMILFSCFVWVSNHWNISFHIYTDLQKHIFQTKRNSPFSLVEEIRQTSWYDKYPIIYRVSYKNAATMTVVDKLRLPRILDFVRTKWCIFIPLQDRRVSPKNPWWNLMRVFCVGGKNDVFFFLMAREFVKSRTGTSESLNKNSIA